MPFDRPGDPWSGTAYNGFAGAPPPGQAGPAPSRRRSFKTLTLSGVAVAVVLGVGLGFLARPKLDVGGARSAQASQPAPSLGQVPIAVAPAPAPTALTSQGRLEVLPPDLARLASPQAALPKAPVADAGALPPPPPALAPEPAPALAPAPAMAAPAPAPAPAIRASFDCATARPGAEQAVCGDAGLAAADRRLAQAWRRAMASGADPRALRQEQGDWLAIREDAAAHSRRALAQVYAQRTAELDQMAQDVAAESGE